MWTVQKKGGGARLLEFKQFLYQGDSMKNVLFTLVAALCFAAPVFANEEIVVTEEVEDVTISQDCGCSKGKDKDKKPTDGK